MRHLSADPRRDPQGRGVRERQIMPDGSMTPRLDRRGFLKVSTAVGGGLALAVVLPSSLRAASAAEASGFTPNAFIRIDRQGLVTLVRSEEHTSELQSLMRISYAVFCLKK